MSALDNVVAFWVTRVGEARSFSAKNRDGESFTTKKYPLTLMASIESGFDRACQFTLWVTSEEVANKAKALCEHSTDRLALVNDARSFHTGNRKTNTWTAKSTGEEVKVDGFTIWLDSEAQPKWARASLPQTKDSGNIANVDVSDIKVEPKVIIKTEEKPF